MLVVFQFTQIYIYSNIYVHMRVDTEGLETHVRSSSTPNLCNSSSDESPSGPSMKSVEPKGLQLQLQKDTLTLGQVKVNTLFFQNSQIFK